MVYLNRKIPRPVTYLIHTGPIISGLESRLVIAIKTLWLNQSVPAFSESIYFGEDLEIIPNNTETNC